MLEKAHAYRLGSSILIVISLVLCHCAFRRLTLRYTNCPVDCQHEEQNWNAQQPGSEGKHQKHTTECRNEDEQIEGNWPEIGEVANQTEVGMDHEVGRVYLKHSNLKKKGESYNLRIFVVQRIDDFRGGSFEILDVRISEQNIDCAVIADEPEQVERQKGQAGQLKIEDEYALSRKKISLFTEISIFYQK